LEKIDGGGKFKVDSWVRKSGGGGISRGMQGKGISPSVSPCLLLLKFLLFLTLHLFVGGKVFEKAGVNLSVVYGKMPQSALIAATERGVDRAKGMKGIVSLPLRNDALVDVFMLWYS
jgi:coproporphyrinogen III oxidase